MEPPSIPARFSVAGEGDGSPCKWMRHFRLGVETEGHAIYPRVPTLPGTGAALTEALGQLTYRYLVSWAAALGSLLRWLELTANLAVPWQLSHQACQRESDYG